MSEWNDFKQELSITKEDTDLIELEKDLISAMVAIREEQGLSQTELAERSHVKQPAIARLEKNAHSPQIDSLLRILAPMGYTLQIVPLKKSM